MANQITATQTTTTEATTDQPDHAAHEIVRAGAGAGKTYTLTHKVMDIADDYLAREKRFPRLVVTTFTRKATQELRERLMLLALEERPHLIDFVNSRSQLVVSTIHGVMDLFLKRYGAEICVDPGYTVISSGDASKLARQVMRKVLLEDEGESGVPGGAGLLEVYSFDRLVSLVRRLDGLLTETPNATPFDVGDFEKMFDKKAKELARDLHSVALNIKDESTKADWLEMAESFERMASLLKQGRWIENRARVVTEIETMKSARRNAKSPPVTDFTADEAQAIREAVRGLKDPLFDPEAWATFAEKFKAIDALGRRFSEEFRKAKLEQGLMEISDLEHRAMDCIRSHPQTSEAFWKEWDHWLVDEYQDTSPFQVELLRHLSGLRPNFIVGDPQQSIYLFRGARSEVFGAKEREIVEGGGQRRLLAVNRRSKPELLLFLNDFFSKLEPPFQPMEPFLKEGESIDPSRRVAKIFVAGTGAEGGGDEAESDGEAKAETKTDAAQSKEELQEEETRALVVHVQSLLADGVKPEDVCVLARTNQTLADIAASLNRAGVPTHVHAASGFFDRLEIRDALSLLKFLVNPHDNFNLVQLLRSPWYRVPDRSLAEVSIKRPGSLWEALVEQRSMADEFRGVARLERLVEASRKLGLAGAFKAGLIDSGFVDLSRLHDVSGRRESNVWKLLASLEQEERAAGFNPIEFIKGRMSGLKTEEGNAEGDAVAAVEPDRVNLMTVHASKGLEFKHVVLPRMQQKPRITTNEEFTYDEQADRWAVRVPWGENGDMTGSLAEKLWLERFQKQELQEHARVLYVALTRAVESVFLSWCAPAVPGSWAEMVRLDLAPGVHAKESYSYEVLSENPAVKTGSLAQTSAAAPRKPWKTLSAPENALGLAPNAAELKSLSVTDILDRKPGVHFATSLSSPAKDVAHRMKVAAQGTAVHRLMELLKYPSRTRLDKLVSKWFPGEEDRVLAAVEFVRDSRDPAILEIIENGSVEWSFAMVLDGVLIPGQVDLWGRTKSGEAWIVDYKTGNPLDRAKAFEQMSIYAVALRKSGVLRDGEPLRLAAVYPFSREIYFGEELTREQVREKFGFKVHS